MTYDAEGLVCIQNFIGAVSGSAKKLYTYTTNDTKAVIEAASYFSAEVGRLNVGDALFVCGDLDGTPYAAMYVVSGNDGTDVSVTYADLGVLATAAEINRACDLSTRIVNLTDATLAVTLADHDGKTIVVNRAAGSVLTLPAAAGSGARLRIVCKTTITSNALTVQVANASDIMQGVAILAADGGSTSVMFETAADTDTISGNGSTTGGIKGDMIELEDVATNLWQVKVIGSATGTEATPFSAAVA